MSTTATSRLETAIKDHLKIKWIAARDLAAKAKAAKRVKDEEELEKRHKEVLQQAAALYKKIPRAQKKEIALSEQASNSSTIKAEPAWQRRAREQAERREREWAEEERAIARARGEDVPDRPRFAVKGPKKVTRVTRTIVDGPGGTREVTEEISESKMEVSNVKVTKFYCTCDIL